jgi:hypothetical protein
MGDLLKFNHSFQAMESPTQNSIYSRNKRIIIFIGVLLLVLTTPLDLFFEGKTLDILNFVSIIGFNLLIFAWCHYDALERNEPFGAGWRLLVILLGIFALFIYLFKTRGFKHGLISIGKTLLILVAAAIGAGVITAFVILIKEAI